MPLSFSMMMMLDDYQFQCSATHFHNNRTRIINSNALPDTSIIIELASIRKSKYVISSIINKMYFILLLQS